MDISSDSILVKILEHIPAGMRPYAEIGLLAIVAISAVAVVLNPILELIRNIRSWFSKKPPPPETLPSPPEAPPQESAGRIIWLSKAVTDLVPPLSAKEGGIPILTFGNMKGGVGKTTVTANLAAYFDKKGKRCLLIDFDYQGSLSSTVLAEARTSRFRSIADDLILGEKEPRALLEGTQTLHPAMPNSRIFTSYYDFSNTETFVLANWLMGNSNEIRFRLSKLLRSEVVRANYDIVLIDAGPRFSTSTINALTASTHLVIPTILDQMSTQAVGYFSKELDRHKNQLFPNLELLGVVPTFVTLDPADATEPRFNDTEKENAEQLDRELRSIWGKKDSVLREGRVPDRSDYAKVAGYGVAFYHYPDAERVFSRLGDLIAKQLRHEGFRI